MDIDDDDFLKKLDEAINDESVTNVTENVNEPPSKKICLDKIEGHEVDETDNREETFENIEKIMKEETLLKEDKKVEIKSNDPEPIIDEKSENELLKGLDDDNHNTEVNSKFDYTLISIQNKESSTVVTKKNKNSDDAEKKLEQTLEKSTLKAAELTREESNELLLELCESPTIVQDEQLSNDTGSNQDDSNEGEYSESDKNKDEEEMQDEPTVTEKTKDEIINIDYLSSSQLSSLKTDDNEQNTQEVIKFDQSGQIEVQSSNESDNFKVPVSKKIHDEKMAMDDSSSDCAAWSEEGITESDCVTKIKSQETMSSNEEAPKIFDSSSQEQQQDDDKNNEKEEKEAVKEETAIKEQVKVKLNFIRKFASSVEKLSRSDLEELLLEKITESIVYRSEFTDLRTKCEKQNEIIDNLKQRIQSIAKQYNDLDMIHKRIVKDLKERPDQPITPVKITRAVGLQVYQPHNHNYNNNSNNSSNNLKPKFTATTTTAANKPTVKRPNESSDINEKEAEAKRKKSNKIITPMRPPLSEKEKASLEKQEATIEQKIRTKVIKSDAASLSAKPTSNGIVKIQR